MGSGGSKYPREETVYTDREYKAPNQRNMNDVQRGMQRMNDAIPRNPPPNDPAAQTLLGAGIDDEDQNKLIG